MADSSIELLQKRAELKLDRGFQPCPAEAGDELYANGIFEFNIGRLLAFISAHSERFRIESVKLADIPDYGGSGGSLRDQMAPARRRLHVDISQKMRAWLTSLMLT